MHKLRAIRYNTGEVRPSLTNFIVNDLHRLEYPAAMRFYNDTVKKLSHDELRLLGANDRFFLLTTLLRRKDAFHPWLYARCREVEAAPDGYLDLWARYHFKSSIITFAGSIQEVIINPEITICILSNVKSLARAFLRQIKEELQNNKTLKTLYSDVFYADPKRQSPRWAADGIIVKRNNNTKEATIEASGLVDGQPVGAHYDGLIFDDIVTRKQAMNPNMVRLTVTSWENADNLGKPEGTWKWTAGTRWSHGDPYGQIIEDKRLKLRKYPATKDGTLTGEPVLLTKKRWIEIKKWQKSTVSAQMLLDPVAGNEAIFKTAWFRPYFIFPSIMNVYIMVDSSAGKKRFKGDQKSDRTAIAVVGIDPRGNKYLLDGYRHRMPLSQRYTLIQELRNKWQNHTGVQMVKVGYERYGKDADTEVIEDLMRVENDYFELIELAYPREGGGSKLARIERMEPDFSQGRFFLPGVVYRPDMGEGVADPQAFWKQWLRSASPDKRQLNGTCLWSIWSQEDEASWLANEAREMIARGENPVKTPPISPHEVGKILYRPFGALTKVQRFYDDARQWHRIVKYIRRVDEDGELYDLTECAMSELRLHPFAPHDDLVDVMSRIYDMEPMAPELFEGKDDVNQEDEEALMGLT